MAILKIFNYSGINNVIPIGDCKCFNLYAACISLENLVIMVMRIGQFRVTALSLSDTESKFSTLCGSNVHEHVLQQGYCVLESCSQEIYFLI